MSSGTLYVVSTPIGNLQDISKRAIEILETVDLIAAEDTRHTRILLTHLGISKRMISYHDHNEEAQAAALVKLLGSGKDIALVSDAGTPGISDPGYRVINLAHTTGYPVVPIPGPSALLAALVASGLPSDRFLFEAFLPRKKGRIKRFRELAAYRGTIIVYESPQRLMKTLQDVLNYLGNRSIAVCRELTKIHEETVTGTVQDVIQILATRKVRGEVVLVIGKEK